MYRIRKYGFVPGIILFLGLTVFYIWNWQEESQLRQVVRLHVIANSDSPADQRLKLMVRDAVLKELACKMEEAPNRDEALKVLRNDIDAVERVSEDELKKAGCDYKVSVNLGPVSYGIRSCDGVMFPAGNYTSLRVVIGEGKGHNWWGVLYPPFCTVVEGKGGAGRIELRMKLLDMMRGSNKGKNHYIKY